MTGIVYSFQKLTVWQEAQRLVVDVYQLLDNFPLFERYALCDQIRRAIVSVPSNIAEGAAKPSDNEFAHFLDMSLGSAFEVETQLLISKNVGYIDVEIYESLMKELKEIERQINGLISSIRKG